MITFNNYKNTVPNLNKLSGNIQFYTIIFIYTYIIHNR